MSEEPDTSGDPVMLVITDLLKPGQLKIARITRNFTLPRLIPVVTLVFSAAGLLIGLLLGFILRAFIFGDSIEFVLIWALIGAGIGYVLATVRLDGQEIWKWAALRFSAASKARTRINNSPTRIVAHDAREAPPVDGVLVAANGKTSVYAVPGRVGRTGRIYAGLAPIDNVLLGEVTILASTTPVKKKRFET